MRFRKFRTRNQSDTAEKIESCPFCGGNMSEIREHNGKRYRHCYACHFEWEVTEE